MGWTDPNASIFYKNTYPDNDNIFLMTPNSQGNIIHGLSDPMSIVNSNGVIINDLSESIINYLS